MHLYYAKTIAEMIQRDLAPYCEQDRCHIAGSVRRKKQEVKDIEIVCIPQKSIREEKNLFEEVIGKTTIIHPEFEKIIRSLGTINKGKFTGRYMQVEMKKEVEGTTHIINIDVFMPQPEDYFRQYAIRTGSSEYTRRFIASQWVKMGWCGCNGDLRKTTQCNNIGENKWVLKKEHENNPIKPPVWRSEQEFFKWLGVQYLLPEHRSL